MLKGKVIEKGKYTVFNNGSVWSNNYARSGKRKRLKPRKQTCGYLTVDISGKPKTIHRLVAECFIPNPDNLTDVNHINEDKTDNRVENLEWCSHKDNCNKGTRNQRIVEEIKKYYRKHDEGRPLETYFARTVYQYAIDGTLICEYPSITDIERRHGYLRSNIRRCCKGEQKTAYGFIWTHTLLL